MKAIGVKTTKRVFSPKEKYAHRSRCERELVGKWQSAGLSLKPEEWRYQNRCPATSSGTNHVDRTNSKRNKVLVMGFQRRDTKRCFDDL